MSRRKWALADGPAGAAMAVPALSDLARGGREQDFRDLAAMVGVPADETDALWTGTVRRLGQEAG